MTAFRSGLAIAIASSLLACATSRRHAMPPPARESRVGAPEKSAGPAPGSVPPPRSAPARGDPDVVRAVDAASSQVGRRTIVLDGVDYGSGCTSLVRAAFARAGHPLPPAVQDAGAVHALAAERGALTASRRPLPGDLVFLADQPGGPPEHVGIVARAEPDGTALVLHRVSRGVLRVRVNLAYPSQPIDPVTGKHINDTLVVRAHAVTAGSLVVGVSDLLRREGAATAGPPGPLVADQRPQGPVEVGDAPPRAPPASGERRAPEARLSALRQSPPVARAPARPARAAGLQGPQRPGQQR